MYIKVSLLHNKIAKILGSFMKSHLIFLGIIIFTIIGCVSQAPAPIEYNYDKNYTQDSTSSYQKGSQRNDKTVKYEEDEIIITPLIDKDLTPPTGVLKESITEDDIAIMLPNQTANKLIDDKKLKSTVSSKETLPQVESANLSELNQLLALSNLPNPQNAQPQNAHPQQLQNSQNLQKQKVNNEPLTIQSTPQTIIPTNLKNIEENLLPEKVQTNARATTLKFIPPVEGNITTKFGDPIPGGKSKGINIIANEGSNVYAVAAGKVIFAGNNSKFGNLLIIKLEEGELYVAYAHLNKLILAKDDQVSQGDIIGYVGHTGDVQLPQLYFAINEGKVTVDPLKYIPSLAKS